MNFRNLQYFLAAAEEIAPTNQKKFYIVGELSLDGIVRRVDGILPMAMETAKREGAALILPADNADEAALAGDIELYPVETLCDAIRAVTGMTQPMPKKDRAASSKMDRANTLVANTSTGATVLGRISENRI